MPVTGVSRPKPSTCRPRRICRRSTEAQAVDEVKLALAVLKYARYARGGRLSPGKISELFDQKPELVSPKTVLTEIAAAPAPAAYLTSLQPRQAQFESLRKLMIKYVANAKARGRKPMADPSIQRLIVNMERWRWMPADLGSYYVWNNVPSFVTRVMKGGKSIYVEKVIVGQPKYATPLFSANMRSIEFNPDWTVPDTIKFEDLAPRLRQGSADGTRDISILTSNKLSVSYQGKPVDAAAVDWNRANIRQVYVYPGARTRQRARRAQVQFSKPARHLHARHHSAGAVQRNRALAEPWLHQGASA